MKLKTISFIFSLLLISTFPVGAQQNNKTLQFEVPINHKSEMALGIAAGIRDALQKQGYQLEVVDLPSKRGVAELQKGRLAGTLGRFGNIAQLHDIKGYTRIDFPLVFLTYSLWCVKNPTLFDKNSRIRLGYHRGAMSIVRMLETTENKQIDLEEMADYRTAVSMLKANRLQCILGPGPFMEAEMDVSKELAGYYKHGLMTMRAFAWIKDTFISLVKGIEQSLNTYAFHDECDEE